MFHPPVVPPSRFHTSPPPHRPRSHTTRKRIGNQQGRKKSTPRAAPFDRTRQVLSSSFPALPHSVPPSVRHYVCAAWSLLREHLTRTHYGGQEARIIFVSQKDGNTIFPQTKSPVQKPPPNPITGANPNNPKPKPSKFTLHPSKFPQSGAGCRS